MRARESQLATDLIPATWTGCSRLSPRGQRLGSFDEVLELLHLRRSMPHAVLMMIPEPGKPHRDGPGRAAFYSFTPP